MGAPAMGAPAMGAPAMGAPVSRRRVLSIIASGATALVAGRPTAAAAEADGSGGPVDSYVWEGTALGAPARLVLLGASRAAARDAVNLCLGEVERLEQQFSLYRWDSALSRLNRQGWLEAPGLDLQHLLDASVRLGERTRGAFDVTVQPLWTAYADYFGGASVAMAAEPPESVIAPARARVGFRRLQITPERITLDEGMAVTLNGIAQGYITDRVADLLRLRGWSRVLVDMGEMRALGPAADGSPWPVGIEVPPGVERRPVRVALADGAIATSAGYATRFEPSGRSHHLFSPASGRSAGSFASVTVVAPRATLADALSTALYVLPPADIAAVLAQWPGVVAYLTTSSGEVRRLPAA
ncbi:MAG: FAD:protein FMN transferase [Rhodospirillales bacterium]